MDVGPLVLSNTNELFERGEFSVAPIPAFACSGPSKLLMVLDEAPPFPKEFHTEDMMGCPETKISAGVICEVQFHQSPLWGVAAAFTKTHTTLQLVNKAGYKP